MKLGKNEYLLTLLCLSLSCSAFARIHHRNYKGEDLKNEAPPPPPPCTIPIQTNNDYIEVLAGLGISKLDADDGKFGVTASETDTLHQTNSQSWSSYDGQLGIGYVYYLDNTIPTCSNDLQWFPTIESEINIYELVSNSIDGDVFRFGSSSFNDFSFDIPVHSTRLMFDAALTIASMQQASVYVIGGIGTAWTRLSYHERPKNTPCPDQTVTFKNASSNSHYAWELGAGITYGFTDMMGVSFEYLYTHFGNVSVSGNATTGSITAPVISNPSLNLSSQTAMIVLHYAI